MKAIVAEFIGTFTLVFGGCGADVYAGTFPETDVGDLGIGFRGLSLALGLTVLGYAYAFGGVSGCHLKATVTAGLIAACRCFFAR